MAAYLKISDGLINEFVKSQISTPKNGENNIVAHYTLSLSVTFDPNINNEKLHKAAILEDVYNTQHLILTGISIYKKLYVRISHDSNIIPISIPFDLPIVQVFEFLYLTFNSRSRTDLNSESTYNQVIQGASYYHPLQHRSMLTDSPFHKTISDEIYNYQKNNFINLYFGIDCNGLVSPGTDFTDYYNRIVYTINALMIGWIFLDINVLYGITLHLKTKVEE